MWRVLLIAEREFKAYATTASFWIALVMGPLLMALTAANFGDTLQPASRTVSIEASEPETAATIRAALQEAADLQGRDIRFVTTGAHRAISTEGGGVRITNGGQFDMLEAALLRRDLHQLRLAG